MKKISFSENEKKRRHLFTELEPKEEIKTCSDNNLMEIIKATEGTNQYYYSLAIQEMALRDSLRVTRSANECYLDHLVEP